MKKAITIALLALLTVSCKKIYPDGDILCVGDRIPEAFSAYGSGEALIVFFSTLCEDCQEELPVVNKLYLENKEVKFIAVGRGQTNSQIDEYWIEESLSLPYQEDPDKKLYGMFATATVPRCYYCRDGVIKNIWKDNPIMKEEDFNNARKQQ